jgi:hypothetical protein
MHGLLLDYVEEVEVVLADIRVSDAGYGNGLGAYRKVGHNANA